MTFPLKKAAAISSLSVVFFGAAAGCVRRIEVNPRVRFPVAWVRWAGGRCFKTPQDRKPDELKALRAKSASGGTRRGLRTLHLYIGNANDYAFAERSRGASNRADGHRDISRV
jgi:hypothetical protein